MAAIDDAPLRATPATDQAYHGIRELILHQGLRPGERTSVASLAERLGLGRTPVKEAITRLTTEGLLVVHDRRGTFVHAPAQKDVCDMFAMRRLLEGYAAKEAVKFVDADGLVEMEELLQRLERESLGEDPYARSMSRFLEADVLFHRRIVRFADNDALSRLYSGMNLDLQIAVYLQRHVQGMAEDRHREHVLMLQALRDRDAALLRRTLREHADAVERVVLDSMTRH